MSLPVSLFLHQLIICVCVAVIMAAVIYLVKWIANRKSGAQSSK